MSSNKLLTEAEILKMSDKDYMNEAQLAFFKNRLEQLRDEILKNADQTTEHLRETVIVPDPADRATIEEEHALELRTRDRERKLLKKVEQSLQRIESGDYGWLVRGNWRADRRAAPAGPSDRHAVAGSATAPRTAPEAVRGLIRSFERRKTRRAGDPGRFFFSGVVFALMV